MVPSVLLVYKFCEISKCYSTTSSPHLTKIESSGSPPPKVDSLFSYTCIEHGRFAYKPCSINNPASNLSTYSVELPEISFS
ncbi:uncharacterized protein OCT59_013450 [Rhizophagus irregularis]|uniref:uncharacterized protein n=1 Tax=Rhizophagus irregularis TaxID=588596 RepID=UPI001A02A830|nr:hypothetical protein OCT59_013450 [Rhizophagus irregularis]GET55441.1 hypothetical protein RIR_jg16188.t1 [Rhizophagus irregularis DAOM 181602=DAOM 197198]